MLNLRMGDFRLGVESSRKSVSFLRNGKAEIVINSPKFLASFRLQESGKTGSSVLI